MQNAQIVRSSEENAQDLAQLLNRLSGDLEAAIPMMKQLFFDFSHLRKGETIMGCRTQDEWSQRYAKRTARALRYLIQGEGPERAAKQRVIRATHSAQLKQAGESTQKVGFNKTETCSVLPTPNLEPRPVVAEADPIRVVEVPELEPLLSTPIPATPVITPAESRIQKLQADLVAERNKVVDLKRLVILSLGGERAHQSNIVYLDAEGRELYDRYIAS